MNIFMLSDTAELPLPLQEALARDVTGRDGRVAYVSSSTRTISRSFFNATRREYGDLDKRIHVDLFELTASYSDRQLRGVLEYGTIHLAGGNSYRFISLIRRRALDCVLKQHLAKGGLIVGVSAGAIVLSPSVNIARIAGDEPESRGDGTGLGIVPFEFYPHFTGATSEIGNLKTYTRSRECLVYACGNREGLRVSGRDLELFGMMRYFKNGRLMKSKTRQAGIDGRH